MLLLLVWLSLSLAYVWQTMVEISDDLSSLLSLLPIRIGAAHGVVREDLAAAVGGPVSGGHAHDPRVVVAVAVGGLGDEDAAVGGGKAASSEG